LQVIWRSFDTSNQPLKSTGQNSKLPSSDQFWKWVWLGVQTSSNWIETSMAWKYFKDSIKWP